MKALVLLLSLLLSLMALAAQARVVDFHADIRIAQSGEVTVTERIVMAPGQAPGLARDLPEGSRVVSVKRNGIPEPHTYEGTMLRTGQPSVGVQVFYEVTYRTSRAVRFLEDYDELRWYITQAELITAEVALPEAVPAKRLRASAGKNGQVFTRDGSVAFRGRETLRLAVRFPKDVVAAPGLVERARWYVADNAWLLVVALLGLAGAGAGLFYYLRKRAAKVAARS
jgi:hypothetical protein